MTSTDSTESVSTGSSSTALHLGLNFLLREKTDSIKTYSNGLDVLGHLGGTGLYHL